MLVILQTSRPGSLWTGLTVAIILCFIALLLLLSFSMRRWLRRGNKKTPEDIGAPQARTDNPAAFMTASMQAVIERLREKEKELAELHRRDKERAQQTERLSVAVTRNMPAGLLVVNSMGIVTSANPAAAAALGYESLNYRRYSEIFGPENPLSQLLTRCLEQGQTYRREEVEYTTPNGEIRQLGLTISPILTATGGTSGALCLLSDLTELKVLQKQMQLKENLAQLGEISAGIAHEFKNALATISGYAQMIRNEASDTEVTENAAKIVEQTRSLSHVVTEFLKFARPLELADEDVTLQALVERVAEEVRQSCPQAQISVEGEFGEVIGDEGLLRQALLNLTRNAAEATGSQDNPGQVILRGAVERAPGHELQRVTILDNGPGIPPEDLPKLFLPFYTTKASGTGLGLAIVQKIVVQHGGRVEARNAPAGGAEFIVWLPLRTPAVRTVDSAATRI